MHALAAFVKTNVAEKHSREAVLAQERADERALEMDKWVILISSRRGTEFSGPLFKVVKPGSGVSPRGHVTS